MVDVKAAKTFKNPVTREQLKATRSLQKMMVLKRGARLSVQPVTKAEFETIVQMGS